MVGKAVRPSRAARKYDRIVQIGTQNRSAPYNLAAKRYLEEGKLGRIHLCRVYEQRHEANFKWGPDSDPPETLDWEMWNGPAPERKYNKAIHTQWRQLWDYGGGQMAYQGIHQIDLARWLCGVDYPSGVYCAGGRFNAPGDAETPDTQSAVFEFPQLLMTYEQTLYTPYMLESDEGIRNGDIFPYWPQNSTRIELYGDKGVMYVGRMGGGWQVYVRPKDRQPVVKDQMYGRYPDPAHKENFVLSVKSRKRPNADIEEGHRSLLLVHYANISCRLGGRKLRIDPKTEHIVDDPKAMKLFKRMYRAPGLWKRRCRLLTRLQENAAANLPGRMRAIEITRFGSPEVLVETTRPMPVPGPGEVLVRVSASGVNRPDVMQRKGNYPPPPGASDLPGLEVAGTLVAATRRNWPRRAYHWAIRFAPWWPAAVTPNSAPRPWGSACRSRPV